MKTRPGWAARKCGSRISVAVRVTGSPSTRSSWRPTSITSPPREIRSIRAEEVTDQNVKIMGYTVGESKIEYFEPTSSDSPIAKFLEKRGNGLHHIAFQVKNLDQKLEELKTANFILIDEKPRTGASGKKIAFLHPKEFNGILIELCES